MGPSLVHGRPGLRVRARLRWRGVGGGGHVVEGSARLGQQRERLRVLLRRIRESRRRHGGISDSHHVAPG